MESQMSNGILAADTLPLALVLGLTQFVPFFFAYNHCITHKYLRLARKRIRYLGLPRSGAGQADSGSLQTIHLAPASTYPVIQRETKTDSKKSQGVQPSI